LLNCGAIGQWGHELDVELSVESQVRFAAGLARAMILCSDWQYQSAKSKCDIECKGYGFDVNQ
jgi:hypothetical protein